MSTKPRIYKWLGNWYCSDKKDFGYAILTLSQCPFGSKSPKEAYTKWYTDTYHPETTSWWKRQHPIKYYWRKLCNYVGW